MKSDITNSDSLQPAAATAVHLFDDWFDPIEAQVRDHVRGVIQAVIEGELEETLQRPRYGRRARLSSGTSCGAAIAGHRHGHRKRSLSGTFGKVEIDVPRARLQAADGKTTELIRPH
jgi:putative transposase